MKTTIELSPALLQRAKRLAAQNSTTLRALVEAGLTHVLAEHAARQAPFVLENGSVDGRGLQREFQDVGWTEFRDAIYPGRAP